MDFSFTVSERLLASVSSSETLRRACRRSGGERDNHATIFNTHQNHPNIIKVGYWCIFRTTQGSKNSHVHNAHSLSRCHKWKLVTLIKQQPITYSVCTILFT